MKKIVKTYDDFSAAINYCESVANSLSILHDNQYILSDFQIYRDSVAVLYGDCVVMPRKYNATPIGFNAVFGFRSRGCEAAYDSTKQRNIERVRQMIAEHHDETVAAMCIEYNPQTMVITVTVKVKI